MIEISGLNQFYGGSHILWDVNLSVPAGSGTTWAVRTLSAK